MVVVVGGGGGGRGGEYYVGDNCTYNTTPVERLLLVSFFRVEKRCQELPYSHRYKLKRDYQLTSLSPFSHLRVDDMCCGSILSLV